MAMDNEFLNEDTAKHLAMEMKEPMSLYKEVNALAVKMVKSGEAKTMEYRDSIAGKLFPAIPPPEKKIYSDSGDDLFYCPLLGTNISVELYIETLFWCIGVTKNGSWRFDPENEKKATFITFFKMKLRYNHLTYLEKNRIKKTKEIPIDQDKDEDKPKRPEPIDEGGRTFIVDSEDFDDLTSIAGIVADQKKLEQHLKTNRKKTYIESFFTEDIMRCTRFGGGLKKDYLSISQEYLCTSICKNNAFFPAMDRLMLEVMMEPPHNEMKQVVQNMLFPAVEAALEKPKRDKAKLVVDAYSGHLNYQLSRPTAYEKRRRYDEWLDALAKDQWVKKEGYSL